MDAKSPAPERAAYRLTIRGKGEINRIQQLIHQKEGKTEKQRISRTEGKSSVRRERKPKVVGNYVKCNRTVLKQTERL